MRRLVLATILITACGTPKPAPQSAAAPVAEKAPAPAPAPVVAPAPAPPADGFLMSGVAACDDFMTKYLRCIREKLPAAAQQSILDSLRQTVDAWKQATATPEGRDALSNACTQMSEATKQAVASMGCTW